MSRKPSADPARVRGMAIPFTPKELAFVEAQAKAIGSNLEDFLRQEILRPLTEEELAGAAPTQN